LTLPGASKTGFCQKHPLVIDASMKDPSLTWPRRVLVQNDSEQVSTYATRHDTVAPEKAAERAAERAAAKGCGKGLRQRVAAKAEAERPLARAAYCWAPDSFAGNGLEHRC
jgi:hypothetical protein